MQKIDIYEVGPRDGLQNLKEYIPAETKLEIIEDLVQAGLRHIQITSFVHPRAIPQMKDAVEVAETCKARYPTLDLFALVPNYHGAKTAGELGINHVSYVVSLSESHNKANINRTHEESLAELIKIVEGLPELDICLDLSTAFGCPFEGQKNADDVLPFVKPYIDAGIKEIDLCDTIGIANPRQVRETVHAMQETYPSVALQVHIHDTRNMGVVNTLAAIECGVTRIQSTLGGLGGCPYAPGASGNLSTEDMVYMLNEMGYDTGVNFKKILEAAKKEKGIITEGVFSGHHINIDEESRCFR